MTVLSAVHYAHHNPVPSLWFASYDNLTQILVAVYFAVSFMVTGVEVFTFPAEADGPTNNKRRINEYYQSRPNSKTNDRLPLGTIKSVNSTHTLSDSRVDKRSPESNVFSQPSTTDLASQYSSYSSISRRAAREKGGWSQNDRFHVIFLSRWCKIGWVLRNISATSTFVSVGIYWSYLHNHSQKFDHLDLLNYITIDTHGINLFLVMIDFLVSSTPFRLLHFIHPLIFNICYIVYNYLYSTAVVNVYVQIGWQVTPLRAVGMFAILLVLVLFSHLTLFLFHCCVVCVDAKTKIGFFITLFCLLFLLAVVFTLII